MKPDMKMAAIAAAVAGLGMTASAEALTGNPAPWVVSAAQDCRHDIDSKATSSSTETTEHYLFNESSSNPLILDCPLVRQTQNNVGAWAYIEVAQADVPDDGPDDGSAADPISCTLFSTDWDGAQLGSATGTFNEAGKHGFILVKLDNKGTSSQWSHYTVQCTLPGDDGEGTDGSASARIYNIALGENP